MQSYDTMKPKVKRKALCTFDFLQKVQLKYESKMRGQVARATENRLLSPSAQTGQGVAELCQAISTRLVPDPPPPGAAVPFASSLCSDIEEANRLCAQGHLQDAYECLRRTADATL